MTTTSTDVPRTSATAPRTARELACNYTELDKIFWFWSEDAQVAQKFFVAVAAGRIKFVGTLDLVSCGAGTPASDVKALKRRCDKFEPTPDARALLQQNVHDKESEYEAAAAAREAAAAALESAADDDPQRATLVDKSVETTKAASSAWNAVVSARKTFVDADDLFAKACLDLEEALVANSTRRERLFAWLEGDFHDDTMWSHEERMVVSKALRPPFTFARVFGDGLYVDLDTDLITDMRGDAKRTKR